jgi:two-component system, LuxR family, sensor kinase FixL
MKRTFKMIEPNATAQTDGAPYQEIAIYVRDLLRSDYALVALLEDDSIRIRGFVGPEGDGYGSVAPDLISRLRNWGPVIVDDASVIAGPVSSGGNVVGLLIGYSSKPGTFTTEHLEKLMGYAPVAAIIIENAAVEEKAEMKANVTTDDLCHFFRLITMGEFSACFAHEVRNPLMHIRGNLQFIKESIPPGHPLRSRFEAIDRASRRIEETAKRMLDFSKKRTRRLEHCDVDELISDALRFVRPYVRSKFIDVQVRLDPELPAIDADRWQMVQAFVNVLQNAVDAMAEAPRRVLSIGASIEQNRMQIGFSDTGAGIETTKLSRIFEAFFTTKGDQGTGLGLYITRQIVEDHGGTVSVETGGRGTTFNISLPL